MPVTTATELSVVLLDLDDVNKVNNTFGHQAGDKVLVEFAQRLIWEARDTELVARTGGEEFAWLMPDTSSQGAYQAAERGPWRIARSQRRGTG